MWLFLAFLLQSSQAGDFFVSSDGKDSNSGKSPIQSWKTITFATSDQSPARPGDTIYVKAGLYQGENVIIQKDRLKIVGYHQTPNDQPPILIHHTDPFEPFDSNTAPLLDGGDRTKGIAINLQYRKKITLKNINIQNYAYGVLIGNLSTNDPQRHYLYNVNLSQLGDFNQSYSGIAISLGAIGTHFSHTNQVKKSRIVNASAEGLTVFGYRNSVSEVKVYCNENQTPHASMDYYITIFGSHNLVEHSLVFRQPGIGHGGHGFTLKTNSPDSPDSNQDSVIKTQFNRIQFNQAYHVGGGFTVRHRGVTHNTFYKNEAFGNYTGDFSKGYGEGRGIGIRDGASNNRFIGTVIRNTNAAISFLDTMEDGDTTSHPTGHPGNRNIISDTLIENSNIGIYFNEYNLISDAGANLIKNSTFKLVPFMFYVQRPATKMKYENVHFEGTNPIMGNLKSGTYQDDLKPVQFQNCTFKNNYGGI